MDPVRWRQIENVFHLAFERPPSQRAAFLELACGTDAELRMEVESLLAEVDESNDERASQPRRVYMSEGQKDNDADVSDSGSLHAPRRLGRYELLEQVGKGGMGVVYRAFDPAIGRTVAIKTIPLKGLDEGQDEGQDPELRMRLLRESQAGGLLSHPYIVAVYDVNEQGSTAYIVMEFVVGQTLEQAFGPGMPGPSLEAAIRILEECANALDYAHRRGVIHRDIKPANIMLQADGSVKVADFGIAKAAQLTSLTQSSVMLGSPHSMAPEQWRGEEVTGQTDQYALAAVAYLLLTGRRPFHGDSMATLATKVLFEEPPRATSVQPSLPSAVDNVFCRAFSKAPTNRYDTCTAFVVALRASLGSGVPAAAGKTPAPHRHFRVVPILLAATFVLAAAVAVWLYQRNTAAQLEIAYWTSIKDSQGEAPFEEYLKRYPAGQFAGMARSQLETLKKGQPPIVAQGKETAEAVKHASIPDKSSPRTKQSGVLTPAKPASPLADQAYAQAETLMKTGDYAGAVSSFTKALAATPEYRSYFGRANAHQRLEQFDPAIADYTQAIHLNAQSAMAYHERAICLAHLHREDAALPDFNRAIELSPAYALSWNGRGAIYLHRKDYQRAISDFNEAIRLQPTFVQAYKNRAAARKATGDLTGASADLDAAGKLKP